MDVSWGRTQSEVKRIRHTWEINNFSFYLLELGEFIESPSFPADTEGTVQWRLKLYPKGIKEECKDYLSIFLRLYKGNEQLSVKYVCCILNPKLHGSRAVVECKPLKFSQGGEWGYDKFVKKDQLQDAALHLLSNDTLTIQCDIDYVGAATQLHDEGALPWSRITKSNLPEDLGDLLESKEFSDVTICTDGAEFKAHRAILAARSPVFKKMFSQDMKESRNNYVKISHFKSDVFQEMLTFMYTGKSPRSQYGGGAKGSGIDREFVINLLKAAHEYQLDILEDICEEFLERTLSVDSMATILDLANVYDRPKLKERTLTFMKTHPNETIDNLVELFFTAELSTSQSDEATGADDSENMKTAIPLKYY